jgi:hypothetical protein
MPVSEGITHVERRLASRAMTSACVEKLAHGPHLSAPKPAVGPRGTGGGIHVGPQFGPKVGFGFFSLFSFTLFFYFLFSFLLLISKFNFKFILKSKHILNTSNKESQHDVRHNFI